MRALSTEHGSDLRADIWSMIRGERRQRRRRLWGAIYGDNKLSIGFFFWFGFGTEALYSVLEFFFFDKHLSPLCWFVLLLLCRLYWGLVFFAFSARMWSWVWFLILCVGIFFFRIRGWVCFVGLAVGLALLQLFYFILFFRF